MKIQLLIIFYFFCNIVSGQSISDINQILKNNYPDSVTNKKDWIFYIDNADCEKIYNAVFSKYFPQYNVFAANLTFKIRPDWKCRCVIFFDSTKNDFILQEPLSMNGIDERLKSMLKNLIFIDTLSLLNFIDNFHQIRQIGSQYKFIKRNVSDSLLSYYVVRFDDQDYITKPYKDTKQSKFDKSQIMGNFFIKLENYNIKEYIELSPNQNLK